MRYNWQESTAGRLRIPLSRSQSRKMIGWRVGLEQNRQKREGIYKKFEMFSVPCAKFTSVYAAKHLAIKDAVNKIYSQPRKLQSSQGHSVLPLHYNHILLGINYTLQNSLQKNSFLWLRVYRLIQKITAGISYTFRKYIMKKKNKKSNNKIPHLCLGNREKRRKYIKLEGSNFFNLKKLKTKDHLYLENI